MDEWIKEGPVNLYQEGYTEQLGFCGGDPEFPRCTDDEFLRDLENRLFDKLIVFARGMGQRELLVLNLEDDVLHALELSSGNVVLIPVCAIYLYYSAKPLPLFEGSAMRILLGEGGGDCRGCRGMAAELARHTGKTVNVFTPECDFSLLVTEVSGLAMRGVSGSANVSLRLDCVDSVELSGKGA